MINSSLRIIEIGCPPEPRPEAARLSSLQTRGRMIDRGAVVQGI